jgi:hypothetical protein
MVLPDKKIIRNVLSTLFVAAVLTLIVIVINKLAIHTIHEHLI